MLFRETPCSCHHQSNNYNDIIGKNYLSASPILTKCVIILHVLLYYTKFNLHSVNAEYNNIKPNNETQNFDIGKINFLSTEVTLQSNVSIIADHEIIFT